MLNLSKGYLKNFHFSGDNNIQSETPAARLPPNDATVVMFPASGQAGVGRGFGVGAGSSPTGSGDATGMGMKTTGVSVVETAFQTKPFPIRSILLYEAAKWSLNLLDRRRARAGFASRSVDSNPAQRCRTLSDRFRVVALCAAERLHG